MSSMQEEIMSRWIVKLLALVGTFLLPLICTLLPYKVSGYIARRGASGKRILSYLMCFGGGIFFGTYLLHMGPEVQTILKESLLDPHGITYPVAELIVGVGFFIVLFAEKFVLRWNKRRMRLKREELRHQPPAFDEVCVKGAEQTSSGRGKCVRPPSEEMCPECIDGKQCSGASDKIHGHKVHENASQTAGSLADASARLLSQPVDVEDHPLPAVAVNNSSSLHCADEHCTDQLRQHQDPSEKHKQKIVTMEVEDELKKDIDAETGSLRMHGGHHHATRSLILILALSLHRIFEGMSIGLQQTVASVVSLFGAVMCHETVIGFSLGLQFVRSGFALRRLVIMSLVCSLIMPLGVFIGLTMTEFAHGGGNIDIANGLLQAIAMGTFIYVTFFEILQEEVDSDDTSLGKIVCIAAGFALMALLNLVPEGDTTSTSTGYLETSTAALLANATLMA